MGHGPKRHAGSHRDYYQNRSGTQIIEVKPKAEPVNQTDKPRSKRFIDKVARYEHLWNEPETVS